MSFDYQLLIIGAGSGGLAAAELVNKLGLERVGIIEAGKIGGDRLHSGCIPSKALLYAARQVSLKQMTHKQAWTHVNDCIASIQERSDSAKHLQKKGIKTLTGKAEFVDAHSVAVDGDIITSKYFLVATGAAPNIPVVKGIENIDPLTVRTVFNLTETPDSITIVGGGETGCEMATAFADLGSEVHLVHDKSRLLPDEDLEASKLVATQLEASGVNIYCGTTVTQFSTAKRDTKVSIKYKGKNKHLKTHAVLLATGKNPTIPPGLEAIGVQATPERGIAVDKHLRTNVKNIYAVGDCTDSPKHTHIANQQAYAAVSNMISPIKKRSLVRQQQAPAIIFTRPEIGRLGMSEKQVKKTGKPYDVFKMPLDQIDRSITDDSGDGYIKLLINDRGRLLGASVAANNASELLAPLALIYQLKKPVTELAHMIIPYPTLANGLTELAMRYNIRSTKDTPGFDALTRNWH